MDSGLGIGGWRMEDGKWIEGWMEEGKKEERMKREDKKGEERKREEFICEA